MKTEPISFSMLKRFLTDLGFVMQLGEAAVLFGHQPTGCRLFFRHYRETDVVDPRDLVSTRHFLDVFNLVERKDFEDRLRQHAVAS